MLYSAATSTPSLLAYTATASLSSVRPITVPSVAMLPVSASNAATTASPTAVPAASSTAAPTTQSTPITAAAGPTIAATAPPAPKRVKKGKATLALTPEEFEKENIRVERDACRFEMNKLATEKKDLSETVEILTTRCRLFEEERNNQATRMLFPKLLQIQSLQLLSPLEVLHWKR